MGSLWKSVDGKKAYLVAVAVIVMGLQMYFVEGATIQEALTYILNGLGLAALRHGVAKAEA